MPQTHAPARDSDPATDDPPATAAEGVVVTQRLVATGSGPATGTFSAFGALAATGTVVGGAWGPIARKGGHIVLLEGTEHLVSASGELTITLRASLSTVPGTGMLTGGGTWNIAAASGEYDGTRAAGTLTVSATVDGAGTTTFDLVLTGRTPGRVEHSTRGSNDR